MRLRPLAPVVVLAAFVLLATLWLGWPAAVAIGAGVGVLASRDRPAASARDAALATILGWGALLARALVGGRGAGVVAMLGSLAGLRGARASALASVLALATLGFGALLAWSAATLVAGLLGRVTLSATPTPAPLGAPDRAPAARTP